MTRFPQLIALLLALLSLATLPVGASSSALCTGYSGGATFPSIDLGTSVVRLGFRSGDATALALVLSTTGQAYARLLSDDDATRGTVLYDASPAENSHVGPLAMTTGFASHTVGPSGWSVAPYPYARLCLEIWGEPETRVTVDYDCVVVRPQAISTACT